MSLNVIKIGGAVLESQEMRSAFLRSFAVLPGNRILVHGGGRTATSVASRLGMETKMAQGRRITDAQMLEVVTMVYGGLVNKNAVAELQSLGVNAIGLSGADLCCVSAHKRLVGEVDYGFVGDVDNVNSSALSMLIESGAVPVIAPLSFDPDCGLLNTNADTIAMEVAKAMAAVQDGGKEVTLTFCFEKPGVLSDPDNDDSVIPYIDSALYQELKDNGVIYGGMIPKLDNAFGALRAGVSRVVITSAGALGSSAGTQIKL
ncbi:MAG: acetylglutamate kinase [Candidatus Cryptobacteroides sp.]